MTYELTLERKEARSTITGLMPLAVFADHAVLGSVARGFPIPSLTRSMPTLSCRVPIFQPSGTVSVPLDGWAPLRALLREQFDGLLRITEGRLGNLKTVGEEPNGLPCLEVEITVPDGTDRDELINAVDPVLDRIVREHLNAPVSPVGA